MAVGLARTKRVVSLANPRGLASFSSPHGRDLMNGTGVEGEVSDCHCTINKSE